MSVGDLLARLTRVLDDAGIPTMFCGSIASTYYGIPRTTQDVDLVVDLRPEDVPRLLAAFPEDQYYVSEDAVRDAVRRRSPFNIIDFHDGVRRTCTHDALPSRWSKEGRWHYSESGEARVSHLGGPSIQEQGPHLVCSLR